MFLPINFNYIYYIYFIISTFQLLKISLHESVHLSPVVAVCQGVGPRLCRQLLVAGSGDGPGLATGAPAPLLEAAPSEAALPAQPHLARQPACTIAGVTAETCSTAALQHCSTAALTQQRGHLLLLPVVPVHGEPPLLHQQRHEVHRVLHLAHSCSLPRPRTCTPHLPAPACRGWR